MHTDLSPHLHTEECNKLISALSTCHNEYTFGKFLGFCNSIDNLLGKCLKKERLKRREENMTLAKISQASRLKRMIENPEVE